MDIVFWLSVAGGAGVLIVHAHQMFYDPNLKTVLGRGRYPILKGVEIDNLASTQTQTRGYLFYHAVYLAIYAALIVSVEFFGLVLEGAQSVSQDGPQGAVPTLNAADPLLGGAGDTTPLGIALFMVALMSARSQSGKAIRRIEAVLRNLAHRLAGIPHSIFRLISRLNQVDFGAAIDDGDAPHLQVFEAVRATLPPDVAGSPLRADALDATADNLRAIDALAVPVLGQRDVFPVRATEALTALIAKQRKEHKAMSERLEAFRTNGADVADIEAFRDQTGECLRNLKALFAILYSQSDLDRLNDVHAPTAAVVASLRQPDPYRIADKAILAVGLACFAFFLLYPLSKLFIDAGDFFLHLELYLLDTVYFVVPNACLLVFSITLVIGIRRAALDVEEWPDYRIDDAPVARMLRAAAVAAAGATALTLMVSVALDLAVAATAGDGLPGWTTLRDVILFNLEAVVLHFLLGVVAALAALVVADQHLNWPARTTIAAGGTFALPYLLLAIGGRLWLMPENPEMNDRIRAVSDAAMMGAFALAVFALLAYLIERAADGEADAALRLEAA